MSRLRPELSNSTAKALPDATALYMITDAVARRTQLIRGALHAHGLHCAIGAFFEDNPKAVLNAALIDEVAAYNDSVPDTFTQRTRRNRVLRWLRWRLRVLEGKKV